MSLLNTNSLWSFGNLYSWWKVHFLLNIIGRLSVSLCTMQEHPFIISNKCLIVHSRLRIGTNLLFPFTLPIYWWSFLPEFGYAMSDISINWHNDPTSSLHTSFLDVLAYCCLKQFVDWPSEKDSIPFRFSCWGFLARYSPLSQGSYTLLTFWKMMT